MAREVTAGDDLQELSIGELLELGYMGLELGYYDQSERYYDAVLSRVPSHPRALLGKAKASRHPDVALDAVHRLLEIRPASREAQQLDAKLQRHIDAQSAMSPSALRPAAVSPLGDRPPDTPPNEDARRILESLPQPTSRFRQTLGGETPKETHGPRERYGLFVDALARLWRQGKHNRRRIGLIYTLVTSIMLIAALVGLARTAAPSRQRQEDVGQAVNLLFDRLATPQSPDPTSTPVDEIFASAADVLRRAALATTLLAVPNTSDGTLYRGSGVVLTSDGLLITNYHVLAGRDGQLANPDGLVLVGLAADVRDPPSDWYIAALVASDPVRDLAVLRILYTGQGRQIRGARFIEIPQGNSNALDLGEPIMALGYPALGGDTITLTKGSMAGYAQQDGVQLGKTDSELLPGSSGGAVLDEQGGLIGIITRVQAEGITQGRLSYFVLLDEAQPLIRQASRAPRPHPDVSWLTELFAELTTPVQ